MEKQNSPFERGLVKAGRLLKNVQSALDITRELSDAGLIKEAFCASFELAYEAEKLTLLIRTLPAYTGHPRVFILSEKTLEKAVSVEIGFTPQGWFRISIPALLPKKTKGSPEYIRSLLYPAMRRFFQDKEPIYYPECILIFRHIYNRSRPEREYRDHDNIEINMVADIIAFYVMKDDAPLRCSHYYCSAMGDEDRTEVYVVPKDDFSEWLDLKSG